MSGLQNIRGALNTEYRRGWGTGVDDGQFDLSGDKVLCKEATVTLAQLNAGYTIVPEVGGRTYVPVGFYVKFNGTFLTATDIRLSDTNSSPVDIVTIAIAQAGTGVTHMEGLGTNTLGTLYAGLTAGKGIQIRKTGSAATGGTNILVGIRYRIST